MKKQELIEMGKQDFMAYLTRRGESVAVEYKEGFDTACKEGYKCKVINNNLTVFFLFEAVVTATSHDSTIAVEKYDCHDMIIPVGLKTESGYFSKKKLPVSFEYQKGQHLALDQAMEWIQFRTDAKENTFDPFWHENEAKRRNAAGWNAVAIDHITDPYCTR